VFLRLAIILSLFFIFGCTPVYQSTSTPNAGWVNLVQIHQSSLDTFHCGRNLPINPNCLESQWHSELDFRNCQLEVKYHIKTVEKWHGMCVVNKLNTFDYDINRMDTCFNSFSAGKFCHTPTLPTQPFRVSFESSSRVVLDKLSESITGCSKYLVDGSLQSYCTAIVTSYLDVLMGFREDGFNKGRGLAQNSINTVTEKFNCRASGNCKPLYY
jgi:hypothetical protein